MSGPARRTARLALICGGVVVAMVGLAFASVPLYRAFCQATGFNGTVRRASFTPGATSSQIVTVSFDTNVRGLSWSFAPEQRSQAATLGEQKLAFFRATNNGPAAVTGRALYNIMPEAAGLFLEAGVLLLQESDPRARPDGGVPGGLFRRPALPRLLRQAGRRVDAGPITLSLRPTFYPAVTWPHTESASA